MTAAVAEVSAVHSDDTPGDPIANFRSLQYALFLTIFVEILGSFFFFITALYIQRDKQIVDDAIIGE